MTSSVHTAWRALKRGEPGRRFQDWHDEGRRRRDRQTVIARFVRLLLAIVCVGLGAILIFIPGPAVLFFMIAGAIVASESRLVAQQLDRAELMLRALQTWIVRCWRRLPFYGKGLLAALVVSGAAGF